MLGIFWMEGFDEFLFLFIGILSTSSEQSLVGLGVRTLQERLDFGHGSFL